MATFSHEDAAHPLARRLLVAPSINWGRELLRQLARRTGGWAGWEAGTLRGLAGELSFLPLSESGRRAGTAIEIAALIGQALDRAVELAPLLGRARELASSHGFRRSVQDAVLELRIAGVDPDTLRGVSRTRDPARDIAGVLEIYESMLERSGLTDAAGVFRVALTAFDAEAPFLLPEAILIAPGLTTRGLPGQLLDRLWGRGARSLEADAVEASGPDLFLAATPQDEVREALRRAIAEGFRLDEVELVTTDPDAYGIALDGICHQLGWPATMLEGLPLARTRAGRALNRWFAWLEQGLPADLLRQLLESGDIRLAGTGSDSATLARALRSLRIGWGRHRYEDALGTLRSGGWANRHELVDSAIEEEPEARRARLATVAGDLARLLGVLLALTPAVPERGETGETRLSTQQLAAATLGFLALVPGDEQTMERLRSRLQQVAEVASPPLRFGSALASLRETLGDFRAWSETSGAVQPWSSRGGALHLTDLAHAGLTGRPRVFVLGLDADRTAGPRLPDPLLSERLREELGGERIATGSGRRAERRALVVRAIESLTGRVTLSYAAASDLAGHETGPAPILLDIARRLAGKPTLSYTDLRDWLGAPACAVPGDTALALDARDLWLGEIAGAPVLRDGTAAVLAAWPGLARGVALLDAFDSPVLVPHFGLVTSAAGVHDPTGGTRPISASSLELLARCPLAWFYHYALGLQPQEDPSYDPGQWLDARERGAVLHRIYQRFVNDYMGRQRDIAAPAAGDRLRQIVREVLEESARDTPPPSETVRLAEEREIVQAAHSFLAMEREALQHAPLAEWRETELGIDARSVRFPLPDGSTLALKGMIDRVDELPDGSLVIVDYKTGSPRYYRDDPKAGLFRGGRHLQPALYAAAASQMRSAPVARFEYRFPTVRGQNDRAVYAADLLQRAPALVLELLQQVREGRFAPTTDPADCRLCAFQANCRVHSDETVAWNPIDSPRADWARRNSAGDPSLRAMAGRRSPVEPEP